MSDNTWELIVDTPKPILINDLETSIEEGNGLHFPVSRSYLFNVMTGNWNRFIVDMAARKQDDIRRALEASDDTAYSRHVKHIAGISSMYRLNGASLEGNVLGLELSVTDFMQYIGTTQTALVDPKFRQDLIDAGIADRNDPNIYFANPVATCSNIVTSDGMVPIGLRGETVAIYPGVPHIIGGYVRVNGENKPGFSVKDIDFGSYMLTELSQEMGLTEQDIVGFQFYGIVRNSVTRGPEMMYNVDLNMTADQLQESWASRSRDKYEHRNITFHRAEDIPRFLEQHRGTMVPSGEATLTQFARYNSLI